MTIEVAFFAGGVFGMLISAVHNVPRIRDLKREIEFWRKQSQMYEDRERMRVQEARDLLGLKNTKGN